jgi:hypothetical protein
MRTTLPFGVPPPGFIQAQATQTRGAGQAGTAPLPRRAGSMSITDGKQRRIALHRMTSHLVAVASKCRRRPPPTRPVLLCAPVRPVLLIRCRRMVLSLVRKWSDRGELKERTDDVSRCLTGVRKARREWPWARKLERFCPDQSLRPHQFVARASLTITIVDLAG